MTTACPPVGPLWDWAETSSEPLSRDDRIDLGLLVPDEHCIEDIDRLWLERELRALDYGTHDASLFNRPWVARDDVCGWRPDDIADLAEHLHRLSDRAWVGRRGDADAIARLATVIAGWARAEADEHEGAMARAEQEAEDRAECIGSWRR